MRCNRIESSKTYKAADVDKPILSVQYKLRNEIEFSELVWFVYHGQETNNILFLLPENQQDQS